MPSHHSLGWSSAILVGTLKGTLEGTLRKCPAPKCMVSGHRLEAGSHLGESLESASRGGRMRPAPHTLLKERELPALPPSLVKVLAGFSHTRSSRQSGTSPTSTPGGKAAGSGDSSP